MQIKKRIISAAAKATIKKAQKVAAKMNKNPTPAQIAQMKKNIQKAHEARMKRQIAEGSRDFQMQIDKIQGTNYSALGPRRR